jgi:hypothetical protein
MSDPGFIARALGRSMQNGHGFVCSCPLPSHGKGRGDKNPSLSIALGDNGALLVKCHAGCDPCDVLAELWRRGLIETRQRPSSNGKPAIAADTAKAVPGPLLSPEEAEHERRKAQRLWRLRQPIGSIAETYVRKARGYSGFVPPTLGFLPARGDHPSALIAAFGLCSEPEPGVLAIADAAVRAVQLIKLKPDGSGKSEVEPNKVIVGRGALGMPIILAPPNDLLGLAICEGVEDALSIHEATGLGAWASDGATRMPALANAVPAHIDCVNVFGHDDAAGRRGATELAERIRARGVEVIFKFLGAEAAT